MQLSPSALVVAVLLAVVPPQIVPLATPTAPAGSVLQRGYVVPTQDQLLAQRVAALEKDVSALQSQVKTLSTHVHTYVGLRGPAQYMSILDVRNAMVPHSSTDITQYWIPMYVSSGRPPELGGFRGVTSAPTNPSP